jgi:hypothetical protein
MRSMNGHHDVQAGRQRRVVFAEPLDHPGVLLRHHVDGLEHEHQRQTNANFDDACMGPPAPAPAASSTSHSAPRYMDARSGRPYPARRHRDALADVEVDVRVARGVAARAPAEAAAVQHRGRAHADHAGDDRLHRSAAPSSAASMPAPRPMAIISR